MFIQKRKINKLMILERNGKQLSADEIFKYVKAYQKTMLTNKNGRYFNILNMIPEHQYGLDYGCGWGAFSSLIAAKGNKLVGQDQSQNEIDICNFVWKGDDNLNFTADNINFFQQEEFDFVVSNQVIEHTHNPGNYLHQINRILKTNGTLIISVPNSTNPRSFLSLLSKNIEDKLKLESQRISKSYQKQHDHIQAWDPQHFTRLVSTIGFELLEYQPLEGVPLAWPRILSKLPNYIYPKNRLKNYCYTMLFKFKKTTTSNIRNFD